MVSAYSIKCTVQVSLAATMCLASKKYAWTIWRASKAVTLALIFGKCFSFLRNLLSKLSQFISRALCQWSLVRRGPAGTCTDYNAIRYNTKKKSLLTFIWHSSHIEWVKDWMSTWLSIGSLWRQSRCCFGGSAEAGRDLPLRGRGWRSAGVRSLLAQTP